jgi:sortase A
MRAPIRSNRSRAVVRGLVLLAALTLCLMGAANLTQGLAVPVKAHIGQTLLHREFEQRLAQAPKAEIAGSSVVASRSRKTASPVSTARDTPYGALFARLTVVRLGVSEVVMTGDATDDRLDRGPVVIKRGDVASPITILAAHRDTHFAFIKDLREGDVVSLLSATGEVEQYRIVYLETVRWDRFSYPLNPARPQLALATCYPFGGTEYGGPWRRVAWAERTV